MSDPLNPRCTACRLRPAQYGKLLCTECKTEAEAAEKRDIKDRDAGDAQPAQPIRSPR